MIYQVITAKNTKVNMHVIPSVLAEVNGYVLKDKLYDFDNISLDKTWAHTSRGEDNAEGWVSMAFLQPPDFTKNEAALSFTIDELKNIRDYIDGLIDKAGD